MKINVTAPVNSLGYGVASLNILLALDEVCEVAWWPIGNIEAPPETHGILRQLIEARNFYDSRAPSLRIYHQFDLSQHVGNGPHIGFPIFELNKFTPEEKHQLATQDYLFVCSKWAKDIIYENGFGTEHVHVVPLGVDRSIFHEEVINENLYHISPTTFLNIGKWEYRKGHDILLQAFESFSPEDDVRLVMHCYNPVVPRDAENYNKNWQDYYKSSPLKDKIFISEERLSTQHEVAKLMMLADCGVFPARAEGWNLELLEMVAMGKHVITTNYSGHTEFATEDNSLLVHPKSLESAYDGIWFKNQGQWARLDKPEIDELTNHMHKIHQLKKSGNLEVNQAGIETGKKFSWQNTAQAILKVIKSGGRSGRSK